MGILGQPRPAMRKGERRIVERKLARHAGIMRQLEAEGFSRAEASRRAKIIVDQESPLQLPDAPYCPICGGSVRCDDPYDN